MHAKSYMFYVFLKQTLKLKLAPKIKNKNAS